VWRKQILLLKVALARSSVPSRNLSKQAAASFTDSRTCLNSDANFKPSQERVRTVGLPYGTKAQHLVQCLRPCYSCFNGGRENQSGLLGREIGR